MDHLLRFQLSGAAGPLLDGLRELRRIYPSRFHEQDGAPISFRRMEGVQHRYTLTPTGSGWEVAYTTPTSAWRALGQLMTEPAAAEGAAAFRKAGLMIDLSRNAVVKVDHFPEVICRCALAGIDTLFLYMEEVYELEGEPFFGYGRGRYSREELHRIDTIATQFGIEAVPTIQTLGHLEQLFQWEAYRPLCDTGGVLLIDEPRTYELIDKMLKTVSACFRSRRVHIGMDEAHGMGMGRYRELHGEKDRFHLFNRHLKQVAALCKQHGLAPMIWSDMYFRIGSTENDYYDTASTLPPNAAEEIPKEVELVYWDYYHHDEAFYLEWIRRHEKLGKTPLLAVGAWTWGRFWPRLPYAIDTMKPALAAARKSGLSEVLLTYWGDNGAECNPWAIQAALHAFCGLVWDAGDFSERRFAAIHGGSWQFALRASDLDCAADDPRPTGGMGNYAKWIFWHDPLIGFLEATIPEGQSAHYQSIARDLERLATEGQPHEAFVLTLARALALKTELHATLRPTLQRGNAEQLEEMRRKLLPALLHHVSEAWKKHQEIWAEWHKPEGWEVLERRYATLVSRLTTLEQALVKASCGEPSAIAELASSLPASLFSQNGLPQVYLSYSRASSATVNG